MEPANRARFFTPGRVALVVAVASVIAVFFLKGWHKELSLDAIKERRDELKSQVEQHLLLSAAIFFGVYVAATSLSLPIATPLSLVAGFLFDLWIGVLLVSFASTLGSTLAFLGSRYLFRDLVQRRFGKWLVSVNQGLDKDGLFYLLTLRLVPAVPFFVVNLVMGLSRMPVRTFWWVSQLGMLTATFIYVNAGKQLGSIESAKDILSPTLLVSLSLLGLAPLGMRLLVNWWRKPR